MMIRNIVYFLILFVMCYDAFGGTFLKDPFANDKYGCNGTFTYKIDTVYFVQQRHVRKAYCFLPIEKKAPYPVILFCHGLNETDYKTYSGFINHVVSKGYGLIYTPYRTIPYSNRLNETYETLYYGFKAGISAYSSLFDTTKIGFLSHSFGAGAVPYLGNRLINKDGWGKNGVFLYLMSPWYPCLLTRTELARFPKIANLLIQVFDDDRINDPRIALEIFNTIGIRTENKKCMTLYSDSIPGYSIIADHGFPSGKPHQMTVYHKNALFRTFDLLSSITFDNDSAARSSLFTKSKDTNIVLAYWRFGHPFHPASISDNIRITYPQVSYVNFWDHVINPLNDFGERFDYPRRLFYKTEITLKNYRSAAASQNRVSRAQEDSSFERPDSSIGSEGKWFTKSTKIISPYRSALNTIIFEPRDMDSMVPVVFFSHSYRSKDVKIHLGLIKHIVSNGYFVIYAGGLWKNKPDKNYISTMNVYYKAIDLIKNRIDTTRLGFVAQGQSAGLAPAIAQHFIHVRGWGKNGSFLFLSSPKKYYSAGNGIKDTLPDNCQIVEQVYDSEPERSLVDAADVYEKLHLSNGSKIATIIYSDTNCNVSAVANEKTFCSHIGSDRSRGINVLDYYGIYRLIDALTKSAFFNDSSAKKVVFDSGCKENKFMGKWCDGKLVRERFSTYDPAELLNKNRKLTFNIQIE